MQSLFGNFVTSKTTTLCRVMRIAAVVLFSVAPVVYAAAPATPSATVVTPAVAALAKMKGTWTGTIVVQGVHSRPVKLVITKQTATGTLGGVLTTPQDASIHVTMSGKIKANRQATVALGGSHGGGPINGTGSGKVSVNGKNITFTMTWVQGGRSFAGTMTLKKIA